MAAGSLLPGTSWLVSPFCVWVEIVEQKGGTEKFFWWGVLKRTLVAPQETPRQTKCASRPKTPLFHSRPPRKPRLSPYFYDKTRGATVWLLSLFLLTCKLVWPGKMTCISLRGEYLDMSCFFTLNVRISHL